MKMYCIPCIMREVVVGIVKRVSVAAEQTPSAKAKWGNMFVFRSFAKWDKTRYPMPPSMINAVNCQSKYTPAQAAQRQVQASYAAAMPGAGPSRSTLSTLDRISLLSLVRLPKNFLATSLSFCTLVVSLRCSCKFSTLRCRPSRSLSAGYLSARRTSVEMRVALEWV